MYTGKKGQLKIFFGYTENIGKTRAMLKAAQDASAHGMRVLIGTVASHAGEELRSLMEGMETLPPAMTGGEPSFDLDGALQRAPDLIVMDELAHSNNPACRHKKRYQDVSELLSAGIHVYTTVNVSNIESLHDTVAAITGDTTWERIPDSVFDRADQVELIDVEPQELLQRVGESGTSLTVERLAALREIALRRCADRVRRLSDAAREGNTFRTDEHILACLSSAPSNGRIIRTAARMARAFNSRFTALFIETPDFAAASPEDKARLQEHRKLAEELGAAIETVYGEDVPYQIDYVDDDTMYQGDYKVLSAGEYGKADITANVTYINGEETDRQVVASVTISQPVTETQARGTIPRPTWFPTGSFRWPCSGSITSYFGYRNTGIRGASTYHQGLDIANSYGTAIYAADGGTVTYSGWQSGYGYLVIVDHGNGYQTYYGHNSSLIVSVGEHVYKGQQVARMGSTGISSGNHCHFGIKKNGTFVNPLNYL